MPLALNSSIPWANSTRHIAGGFAINAVLGLLTCHALAADTPATSGQELPKPRVEQARPQSAVSHTVKGQLTPERVRDRADLLKKGESALAQLDLQTAVTAFDRAAQIQHAADTEMGLMRTYMQAGEYSRALAFGAHTAGAHLDVEGGTALYAWLLHVGGQRVVAKRLLMDAQTRKPGQPVIVGVLDQLKTVRPLASGALLRPPTRLAPYGDMAGLSQAARAVGSGVLIDGGKHALVAAASVDKAQSLWLRNGLGQLAKARALRPLGSTGVVLLQLDKPLPADPGFSLAARDAFAGSIGHAVEYVVSVDAAPRWPLLYTGFMGKELEKSEQRALGIDVPKSPHGGPVFDNAGQFIGLALPSGPGQDQLVPLSQLQKALGAMLGKTADNNASAGSAPTASAPKKIASLSADKIYEAALRTALVLITAP